MSKSISELKIDENKMLKAWYADSLSLMHSIPSNNSASIISKNSSKWQPCLGILVISNTGVQIFSNENSKICHSYIKSKSLKKVTKINMKIEQFKDGLIITTRKHKIIRILYFDYSSVMGILKQTIPEVELSNSEFHLLMQILCGMSLKEASKADGLSYETKRTQFKSLAIRTGFKSQSEVIRNTLLALTTYALDITNNYSSSLIAPVNNTENFLNIYYKKIFRFHRISTFEGRTLRVIETGPITGKPVIWLHSQTLPSPDQFLNDWTKKENIRLIIPLRDGFLEETKKQYDKQEHLKYCTNDISKIIEFFCNSSAEIIANSTGTAYALNLAVKYPKHIKKLTICAASYVGKYENNSVHRLVNGFKNLTLKNERLATKVLERYITKMSSLSGMREVLKSTYAKSSIDMDIFDKLLANPFGHSWIYESYRMSRYSVIKDISMGSDNIWKNVHKISCKPLFIHGRLDPINSINAARKAAKLIKNSRFIELENEGQSLFISCLEKLVTNKFNKKGHPI